MLAAAALLFLAAAGTIQLVYTVTPSYALLAAACVIGAPWVCRGWLRAHWTVRYSALLLLGTYVVAGVVGDPAVLPWERRAGAHRTLVYIGDLAVGLGITGLVAGLWSDRGLRSIVAALAFGATAAAAYGLYQWPAQRFGWPFADVNNQLTSAIKVGEFQGLGVFGWERIRGTFVEPHFLGGYLAALLPIVTTFAMSAHRLRRGVAIVAVLFVSVAIFLTSSVPAWVLFAVGATAALTIFAVARGWPLIAGACGILAVSAVLMGPLLFASPELLTTVTGRPNAWYTLDFRKDAWQRALDLWTRRPVTGYGPGQSSVRLTLEPRLGFRRDVAPRPLESAHGLWAASLIDGGILGFLSWLLFLTAIVIAAARNVLECPAARTATLFGAVLIAVGAGEIAGDRLLLLAWLLFGLVLASARSGPREGETDGRSSGA